MGVFAASGLLFVLPARMLPEPCAGANGASRIGACHTFSVGRTTRSASPLASAEKHCAVWKRSVGRRIIAAPMVAVLARMHLASLRRADGLTLDFSLVWIGTALALIAAAFLALFPACPLRMRREASASPPAECASPEEGSRRLRSSPSPKSPPHSCCLPEPAR